MKRDINFYLYVVYAGLLGLLFFLFVVMAHLLVGLNYEGSHWFFEILSQHKFVYAAGEWRWSDSLWQLPTYVSLNLLPWIPFDWNLHLLSYSYTLHPFVGVLLCYFIVRKEKNAFLYMTFPLLSLASAVAISLTFVVGISNGTLTLFWPLFFILLFKNIDNIKCFLASAIPLFLMNFNYDLAVILFPLLAIAVIQRKHFKAGIYGRLFTGLLISSFAFQIYRLGSRFFGAPEDVSLFWDSLFAQPLSSYLYVFQLGVLITFLAGLMLFGTLKKPVVLWCSAFLCGVIGFFWFNQKVDLYLLEARHNRMASIFLAWVVAFSLIYFKKFLDNTDSNCLRRYILCCSFVSILMSLIFNFHCFEKWNVYRSSVLTVLEDEKGCIFVDQLAHIKSNAFESLLFQESRTPQSILLTSDPDCIDEYEDPCQRYLRRKNPVYKCRYLYLTGYNMDLSVTKSQMKKKEVPFSITY